MKPMRKDVERLLAQARRDLSNAEKNITIQAYEVAAFLCEQSVEKGLKALYAHARRQRPPATHSLIELGQDLSTPKTLAKALATLNMDYVASRYPDAANGVPGELYTKDMADERVAAAREVWAWLEKQL
jgi:HEPN domain-containing protein